MSQLIDPRVTRLRKALAACPRNLSNVPERVWDALANVPERVAVTALLSALREHPRWLRPLSLTPLCGLEAGIARATPATPGSRRIAEFIAAASLDARRRLRSDGVPDGTVFTHIALATHAKGEPRRVRISLRFQRSPRREPVIQACLDVELDDLGSALLRTLVDVATDYTVIDSSYRPSG